jgi:hypothetical protein
MTDDLLFGDGEDPHELGPVYDELRAAFLVAPPDHVADAHLEAMFAALGAAEAARAPTRVTALAGRRKWIASAAALGALTLTGGLAAAGELPAPLQSRVSAVVSNIGIHVPDGDERDAPVVPDDPRPGPTAPGGASNGHPQNDGNGQSEDAPGHGGVAPGQSEDAPGQGGVAPGKSEDAPGHTDSTNPGNGPGENNGDGPGEHNGNGPGENNGNGPGENNGHASTTVPTPTTTKAPKVTPPTTEKVKTK